MNNLQMETSMYLPSQLQPINDPQRFLSTIRQNLVSQVTYTKACRQLINWCSTLTVYQPQFETSLLACLSAAATCAPNPGFDIELAYQLFQSCFHLKSQASSQFNDRLEKLWQDLNDQILLKRQGNQEQAQRIAQQIQIQAAQQAMPQSENSLPRVNHHFQPGRENPEFSSIGSSETTVSILTTVYSGVTTCTLSPPNLSQTTVTMSSNSQASTSTTTSSPSSLPTPAENQQAPIKSSQAQTVVNNNVTPLQSVQTAAIIAATATATATALTTSKLNQGPPTSPSSDTTPNKTLPQTHRPQNAQLPMSQLERRMSTPLTPVNPLMAALSGPAQFPDSPHQLAQHQNVMTPINDTMMQGLPLDMHSQPPPPYNHVAGQRVMQPMPPPYTDLTPMLPGTSPMQTGYGTPNKLLPQGAMGMMPDYRDPFSASYPPQQMITKLPPGELASPYDYPNQMSRPNSLYLPPAPYDVMSPRTFTGADTKSYMGGLGYDMVTTGQGTTASFLQTHQNRVNAMNFYPMPVTASPTKGTQPMQFPQHMVPTPNHVLTPNYQMQPKVYPQSAPPGFHIPPEFPQMAKDYAEFNKHGDQVIRLTAPIIDGVLLPPFQLQHNNNSITHKFIMKENVFPTLMSRVDLDVQLRCFQQCEMHLSSSWPKDQEIHILINNYRIILNESEGKMQKPLLLKKYCHPGYNVLQLNVSACCCSHMFELQLVHRPSITSVKSRIVKECTVPYKKSLQKIIEIMTSRQPGEDCLHTTSATASLKCPISQKIIEIPIRGTNCRHIQCFDLGSYLHMNHERETWKCPICGTLAVAVEPNNVEVDEYIWRMIQDNQKTRSDNGEEQTEIVIDDKGEWSFVEVKQETKTSPNKRGKQDPDTPNSLSPQDKKPVKRRRLSKKGDKTDVQVPFPSGMNNQLSNPTTNITPNSVRPDLSKLGNTIKDLPLKNLDTFSPHAPHGYARTPLSGPNSVDSRGDKVVNSPNMMPMKNSPGLPLSEPQLDLEPSIQLDPSFSLLDVLQHNEPTPTEDLPYL